MFADIMNDCVMCVELCAPILPRPLVLPTLCATGLGRSLVGVAGGATKAAVAQHQALRNNMAELSAKDGSQVQRWEWDIFGFGFNVSTCPILPTLFSQFPCYIDKVCIR